MLTTDTLEQAIERAGSKAGNKGWQAARRRSRWCSSTAPSRIDGWESGGAAASASRSPTSTTSRLRAVDEIFPAFEELQQAPDVAREFAIALVRVS